MNSEEEKRLKNELYSIQFNPFAIDRIIEIVHQLKGGKKDNE